MRAWAVAVAALLLAGAVAAGGERDPEAKQEDAASNGPERAAAPAPSCQSCDARHQGRKRLPQAVPPAGGGTGS